ncbi:MAG: hypothetical protein AAFR01_14795, partial [Pseudomonadota bacterium]
DHGKAEAQRSLADRHHMGRRLGAAAAMREEEHTPVAEGAMITRGVESDPHLLGPAAEDNLLDRHRGAAPLVVCSEAGALNICANA